MHLFADDTIASNGISSGRRSIAPKADMLSISSFLQQRRVDEAQSLLRRTNHSITEVGNTVGLGDSSHFARMFREKTGLTPTAFRTAVRDKALNPMTHPN